ncbi:MAG: HEPN domain-containing protein [bacterium]
METAEDDYQAMNNLHRAGHNVWALFIGYLVIEKLMKVLYMRKYLKEAPRIHDLERLAELIQIEIDEKQSRELATLTLFNIRARYPDYKHNLHKLATKSFTAEHIKIIEKWRKRLLQ